MNDMIVKDVLKVIESELVYISQNNEIVCDSLQVAKKFGKRHNNVMRDIRSLLKIEQTKQMFNLSSYTEKQNGQVYQMYTMNRDGFSLLAMGFTGEKALEWKLKYIQAFNKMEKLLLQQQPLHWHETRQAAKENRLLETDSIKEFVAYAKRQGSQNADRYYYHLTDLAHKAAGITKGRDKATVYQLSTLMLVEHAIAEIMQEDMTQNKPYREIYKDCKDKIRQFVRIAYLDYQQSLDLEGGAR